MITIKTFKFAKLNIATLNTKRNSMMLYRICGFERLKYLRGEILIFASSDFNAVLCLTHISDRLE